METAETQNSTFLGSNFDLSVDKNVGHLPKLALFEHSLSRMEYPNVQPHVWLSWRCFRTPIGQRPRDSRERSERKSRWELEKNGKVCLSDEWL